MVKYMTKKIKLYIVLDSIYFVDEFFVQDYFSCNRTFNALLMTLKSYSVKIKNCVIFMSSSVHRRSK